MQYFTINYYNV